MDTSAESAMAESVGGQEEPASWREWLGLTVLALPTFLLALDFTALHLALPHLSASLEPTGTQQLWIVDIYGFMIAGFLITMGSLGDRIGRRRILLYGALAFGICSLLAAFSVHAGMLIVARALLGIAGATLMPSTLSLISNMFHQAKQRQFAIAVWLGCFSFGGVIGPFVGGLLLEVFWWGAVFLLGVPVMLLLLVTGPFLLPEYRDQASVKIDWFSALLSVAAMLSIIYGVKELSSNGLQLVHLLILLAGAGIGWLFVRRQLKLGDPLIDLELFRSRAFSGSLVGLLSVVMTLGAFVWFFAQYLQLVEGLNPLMSGIWMIPYAAANILGAMLTPALANRYRPSLVISGGLLLAAVGFGLLFLISPASSSGLPVMIAASVVITFGLSPLMVLSTELVVASAPPAKTGSASSLSETCSELGMALGVAIFGMLGSLLYRMNIDRDLLVNVPDETADTVLEHLAGAVKVVDQFPVMMQSAVLDSARGAFVTGMHVAGGVCVLLLLGLVVMFLTFLRKIGRT